MKKIIFIISVIFLCCVYGIAQNNESKIIPGTSSFQPIDDLQETENENNQCSINFIFNIWHLVVIASLVLLILLIFIFKKRSKNKKNNSYKIDVSNYRDRVVEKCPNCYKLELKLDDFRNKIRYLESQIAELTKSSNIDFDQPPNNKNYDIKFFRNKQGKMLQNESPDQIGASFKIYDIIDNEAKFEYCGNVVNSDFLVDICDFENSPYDVQNKKRIVTTFPGRVRKDSSGNWIVLKSAKIRFE